MAVASLSLCNPLCFLRCKYDKCATKILKRAFYEPGVISNAKKLLLNDIAKAALQENVPTVPERRVGEMRTVNEIDDIFTLIAFMDERKLLGALPVYVSDNPDNMPSIRLYEGDLKGLMAVLDKMNDKLTSHGAAIAAIVSDLNSRSSKSGLAANTANVHRSTTNQGVINNAGNTLSTRTDSDVITGDPVQEGRHKPSERIKPTDVGQSSASWADRATAVSTPRHSHYQTDASSTATDDDQNDNPYTVKQSRNYSRTVKRKVNNGYSPPEQDQPQQTRSKGKTLGAAQRTSQKSVYGRSTDGAIIAAANKLVKKSVFCIDNISATGCVNDIVDHARNQGIDVISCFEAKPRIRHSDNYTNNRKAFRLCISSKHRDKLLNSSSWPDSVVVSEWFFKSQQPSQAQQSPNSAKILQAAPSEKRHRAGSPSNQPRFERLESETIILNNNSAQIGPDSVSNKPNAALYNARTVMNDMDITIIADVHSSNNNDDMDQTILTPCDIIQCQSPSDNTAVIKNV